MKPIVIVGSINADLVVRTPHHPQPGETLTGSSFQIIPGGKGANQAAAAARLGAPTHIIGKVGSDNFADICLTALQQAGVHTEAISRSAQPTGTAHITVSETTGDNSILVVPGANATLRPEDITSNRDLIASAGFVLTQLEIPMRTVEALAQLCEDLSVPLILDPAPTQKLSADLLWRATWLTPNEYEAEQLFGLATDFPEDVLRRQIDQLFSTNTIAQNLALKLGHRGCYIATTAGHRELIPAPQVNAIDTTAAGDCWNAAFAISLLSGDTPPAAARYANAAAALSTTRNGAIPSLPTTTDLNVFLTDQKQKAEN